ncbi:hypothetical protein HY251_15525, partial [bacterium]|nr:hypothetical protein [bacterium]
MSRFEAEELAREIALRVAERVEKDALEFATFLVALRLDDPDLIREGRLEPLRAKAKRLVCAALREQWKGERETDFTRPEARFLYDANARTLEVDLAAVHVYGRYTKLARDLPQTRWHC